MAISQVKVGNTTHDITAVSAEKLTTSSVGSSINPVYFNNGVPTACGRSIPLVYNAAQCTTFTSDEDTCTPAAVKKATTMFAVPKVTATDKAITRFNGTDGSVQNSKIIIEDVTNTKDSSKKAQVIAIPAEGGKKMVYGYCTDQVDGTSFIGGVFDSTATSYPYSSGLAIGGTSGNLLWKGQRVLDNNDLTTINNSIGGKAPSAHASTATTYGVGSSSNYGHLKVGNNITVSNGTISLTTANVTAALGYTPPTSNTTYSAATTAAAGLMSAADKTKLDGIDANANKYSLPTATSSTLGGVKIGSNISVSSDGKISLSKANVTAALGYTPPTTDTVYSHPTFTARSSGLYKITVNNNGHVTATAAVTASDLPSHTHTYAGASTAGGSATSAAKLDGGAYVVASSTQPSNANAMIWIKTS